MSLALIPRSARAISEGINRYYRTLKGIDPESVTLRLPTGGAFEVRHSVTAAPVLGVTDAGVSLTGAVGLPNGTITSAMIADGTIVGADIAPSTITSDKLAGGIAVPANSITTDEIADGTIQTIDIGANQVTQSAVYTFPTTSIGISGLTGMPGTFNNLTTTGGSILMLAGINGLATTATAFVTLIFYVDSVNFGTWGFDDCTTARRTKSGSLLTPLAPGTHNFGLGWANTNGTTSHQGGWLLVLELKR